ncbi:MAG: nicotinate-nucleotide adenylyltransferase [Verrucomicrobiota bacterium]
MNSAIKKGLIIGRFQPFHNEHLEYALAAKEECDYLWIGLSQFLPDSANAATADDHRFDPKSNPLKYCERYTIISDAVVEAGIKRDEFGIIPCPIDTPERVPEIVPDDTICYITVNEPWGETKVSSLQKIGYEVVVLWERPKKIASTVIREAIIKNDPSWKDSVPPSVVENLENLGFRERLQRL